MKQGSCLEENGEKKGKAGREACRSATCSKWALEKVRKPSAPGEVLPNFERKRTIPFLSQTGQQILLNFTEVHCRKKSGKEKYSIWFKKVILPIFLNALRQGHFPAGSPEVPRASPLARPLICPAGMAGLLPGQRFHSPEHKKIVSP